MIGLPDDKLGDKILALIKPRESYSHSMLTGRALRAWGSDKIAKYKLPREVKIVDSIPKNQMGKVNKKELIRIYKG